jgi:hypothetical protein
MADRRARPYAPQRYRHKPTTVEAIVYDGSARCAKAIVAWGRTRTQGATPFEVVADELHMYTRQGARYVPENDLATLGVLLEPYSIDPAVAAVSYELVNGTGFQAPLSINRVRELMAEGQTASDRDRLRQIIGQLGAHCEVLQGG